MYTKMHVSSMCQRYAYISFIKFAACKIFYYYVQAIFLMNYQVAEVALLKGEKTRSKRVLFVHLREK